MYPTQTVAQLKNKQNKNKKTNRKKKQTKTIREMHVGGLLVFMQSRPDGDSVVRGASLLAVTISLPSRSELHHTFPNPL